MSKLRGKQLRWLRAKAHHMKPIVIIGQHRVTEAVVKHIDAALEQHELLNTLRDRRAAVTGVARRVSRRRRN